MNITADLFSAQHRLQLIPMQDAEVYYLRHGTTILDVKDPKHPKIVAEVEIPQGVHSHKVRVSGDIMVALKASRRILTRSGGVPGVPSIGRPKAPAARTTVARRRLASGVLYLSINSQIVGVSVNFTSRLRPV